MKPATPEPDAPATQPPGPSPVWSGSASNLGFIALAAFVLLEAAVLHLMLQKHPPGPTILGAVHGLLVVALELQSRIEVRIDERQLVIRYGRLGWLRQRIPLGQIVAAHAVEVDPLEHHGGWGYRGNLRWRGKAAVVVRAGSALRLELLGAKRFTLTVDAAEGAARCLDALLRRRAPAEAPSAPRA